MAGTAAERSDAGTSVERPIGTWNGFLALAVGLAFLGAAAWRLVGLVTGGGFSLVAIAGVAALVVAGLLTLAGLYTLQPNEAAILQLFGAYRGTSRAAGLRATNPVLHPQEDLAARPQPQRRAAQGQRQAGQPDRDRRAWSCGASPTRRRPPSTSTTTSTS